MLRERLLSAAVGIPLLFALLIIDGFSPLLGLPLLVVVLVFAIFSGEEMGQLLHAKGWQPPKYSGAMLAALPPLFIYFWRRDYNDYVLVALTLAAVVDVLLIALGLISDAAKRVFAALRDFAVTAVGGAYIGITLSYLLLLRQLGEGTAAPLGVWPVMLALLLGMGTDTAAFFGGTYLGRHLLWPALSPKKTWEGLICGGLGATMIMVIFALTPVGRPLGLITAVWLGFAIGMVGHLGDLLESAAKRWAKVKDSGTVLRGHGGALDTFDSLFLIAPALYYSLHLLVR